MLYNIRQSFPPHKTIMHTDMDSNRNWSISRVLFRRYVNSNICIDLSLIFESRRWQNELRSVSKSMPMAKDWHETEAGHAAMMHNGVASTKKSHRWHLWDRHTESIAAIRSAHSKYVRTTLSSPLGYTGLESNANWRCDRYQTVWVHHRIDAVIHHISGCQSV